MDKNKSLSRDAYISMDDLAVGYNGKAIIRDICIDIKKGDIVALIGPNGAGKSTILKSITRQLPIIRGSVDLEGSNMRKIPFSELSKKMAVVLTERLKTDLLTCYDIVASGRYPYTGRLGILSAEDERMVDEAIQAVNAAELGPKDFNEISDGQRQRILLARAICQDPELIILDEPTSFLDIRYKLELLSILKTMAKKKGITVIMSLHEIDLAEKVADKIICVKGETIYDYGDSDDVFIEEKIRDLYDIDNGFFDPMYGSIELPAPAGGSKVFVLSSGGSGIPVYRRLQRENIPFVAGILYPNDQDYRLARLLAAEIVEEKPFEPVKEETIAKAKELIKKCDRVICTDFPIGKMNEKVRELVDFCGKMGDAGKADSP